jgi:predicted small secreted protein
MEAGKTMSKFRAVVAKLALAGFLLASALTTLTACNTTAGLGQDVSNAGHAVTNGADKVKQGM